MSATDTTRPRRASPRARRAGAVALVVGLAGIAAVLWDMGQRRQQTALEELSDHERRALYERTRRTLATTCKPETRPAGLEDFCRDQAALIVQFPECDDPCRTLAAPYENEPTR